MIVQDPYYGRPEVSNSDLSELEKYWQPQEIIYDIEKAYRFGTLIDCMITEPTKVNYFKHTCASYVFSQEEFAIAEAMKKSFYRDELCATLARHSELQKISTYNGFPIEHDGLRFTLDVRCKWDLFALPKLRMTGDIKSTTCTSQKQFEEAVRHFNYDRQRAWYMDIENVNNDILIGISKTYPYKVFKVPVKRDSELYRSGKEKYQRLAFKYWYLFENIGTISI